MNEIINIINDEIKQFYLNENMDMNDWMGLHSEYTREIFMMINDSKEVKFRLIPKNQYHRALQEFVRYREFMRFPEAKIFQWKDLILTNIVKLDVLTAIGGHSQHFPFDEFYDEFDYNHNTQEERDGEFSQWGRQKYEETGNEIYIREFDYSSAYEFLDEVKKMDDYLPLFSNGGWVLSDFGLEPLQKLGGEMADSNSAAELIVLINKVLDVSHQRSDLAELFIEGGSTTLDYISNF